MSVSWCDDVVSDFVKWLNLWMNLPERIHSWFMSSACRLKLKLRCCSARIIERVPKCVTIMCVGLQNGPSWWIWKIFFVLVLVMNLDFLNPPTVSDYTWHTNSSSVKYHHRSTNAPKDDIICISISAPVLSEFKVVDESTAKYQQQSQAAELWHELRITNKCLALHKCCLHECPYLLLLNVKLCVVCG